ncbi:MAG: hypothetical protein ACRC62_09965 [Microcoleus sp.]
MISAKAIRAHLTEKCPQLWRMDIDVFVKDQVELILVDRSGVEKKFKSNRAAKMYLTKLNNSILCRSANAILSC